MEEITAPTAVEPTHPATLHRSPPCSTAPRTLPFDELAQWLTQANFGEVIVYHRGFLALDRGPGSRFGDDAGAELDRIATALMAMAEAGNVHLVQRRHGPGEYSYMAVARSPRAKGARS